MNKEYVGDNRYKVTAPYGIYDIKKNCWYSEAIIDQDYLDNIVESDENHRPIRKV